MKKGIGYLNDASGSKYGTNVFNTDSLMSTFRDPGGFAAADRYKNLGR